MNMSLIPQMKHCLKESSPITTTWKLYVLGYNSRVKVELLYYSFSTYSMLHLFAPLTIPPWPGAWESHVPSSCIAS